MGPLRRPLIAFRLLREMRVDLPERGPRPEGLRGCAAAAGPSAGGS